MGSQRTAERVPFDVPARIDTDRGPIEARAEDISRVGVGLRVRTTLLGAGAHAGLAEVATAIQRRLGTTFVVTIGRQPGLWKAITLARVAGPLDEEGAVHLGCAFDMPMTPQEAQTLNVALPAPAGQEEETPIPRADAGPVAAVPVTPVESAAAASAEAPSIVDPPLPPWRRPRRMGGPLRAVITSSTSSGPGALQGLLEGINLRAVCLRVPQPSDETAPRGVAGSALAIIQTYGEEVSLKLTAGAKHLWTGPARIYATEHPMDQDGMLLVTLAFKRPLRAAELSRLGLA